MSDLTAARWSELTLAKLHELEASCSDDDLFCVGYLIPPVELLEVELAEATGTSEQWKDRFENFVEQCLSTDQVGDADAARIRDIVTQL